MSITSFLSTGLKGTRSEAADFDFVIPVGGGEGGAPLQSRSGRKEPTVVLLLASLPNVRLLLVLRRGDEGIGSTGLFLRGIKYGGRPPSRREDDLVLRSPLRSSLSVKPKVECLLA